MRYLDAIAVLALLVLALILFARCTVYSRHPGRSFRWRVILMMRPSPAFATFPHLLIRWSRFAALRHGGRVRPDLPYVVRMFTRTTDFSWRVGRAQYGKRVFAPAEHQTAVVAPPRQHKTQLLIERIMSHVGACVNFSSRTDLFDWTSGHRANLGPILIFNPFTVGGLRSTLKWDIISGCQDPGTAVRRASALMGDTALGDMAFWLDKAAVALAGLMHAAALAGFDMAAVYQWANKQGEQELPQIARLDGASPELFAGIMEIFRDSKSADSIRMTLNRSLGWLAVPELRDMVCGPDVVPFDAAEFAHSRGTLYMIVRPGAETIAAPLFRALSDHIHFESVLAGARMRYKKLVPGVFFALDEAANVGLPKLAEKLADSAGHGAFFLIVIHTIAQLEKTYGKEDARAIMECCGMKIILPGVTDEETLTQLSVLCGKVRDGENLIPAVNPENIRELPDHRALVIGMNRQPLTVKLRAPYRRLKYRTGRWPAPVRSMPLPLPLPLDLPDLESELDAA